MKVRTSNINYTSEDEKLISEIIITIKEILHEAKIIIPNYCPLEISHHYGLNQFNKYGCVIITIINRAYCKKIIILFPGQKNPKHMHKEKEETFHVLAGNMIITLNENAYHLNAGELITIEQEMTHSFYSKNGCVFEEISTNHNSDDSYYFDHKISKQSLLERKTLVTEWQ